MLSIIVSSEEGFDETKNEFVFVGGYNLELEHSLVSLSKWESLHKKPFLSQDEKTPEEIYSYIKCMAVHPGVPDEVFEALEIHHLQQINEYMNDPMTATTVYEPPSRKPNTEIITSELLYYWIAGFQFDAQVVERWHLRRLFMALKVANVKSNPPKNLSPAEARARTRRLNELRRQKYESNG